MHPQLDTVEEFARTQRGIVSAEQARRRGLVRPWPQRLAAAGRWTRLLRGIYRPGVGEPDVLQVLTAARLFTGGGLTMCGTVVGRSAARLWGFEDARGPWRPELLLPTGLLRAQPQRLTYRWDTLTLADVTVRHGFPTVTALHALRGCAAHATFGDGLALADAALRLGVVPPAALANAALPALRLADGASESRFESLVRAELIDAGLPAPCLQHEVRDGGRLVARVDFAWPARGLVVEADGAETHIGAAALATDLRRQNALVALGWQVLRFTWSDLGSVAPRVRSALARRAA